MKNFNDYEIVCCDLFNTLVRNTVRLNPYKKLYQDIKKENPYIDFFPHDLFHYSMVRNFNVEELIKYFSVKLDKSKIENFKLKLEEEKNSLIFNEDLIERLNNTKGKIVLISNLSKEYCFAVEEIKKRIKFDKIILSYDVGILKPEKRIFNIVVEEYNVNPMDIIMIGDSQKMDILGATEVGFDTKLIVKWWN